MISLFLSSPPLSYIFASFPPVTKRLLSLPLSVFHTLHMFPFCLACVTNITEIPNSKNPLFFLSRFLGHMVCDSYIVMIALPGSPEPCRTGRWCGTISSVRKRDSHLHPSLRQTPSNTNSNTPALAYRLRLKPCLWNNIRVHNYTYI